jgi:hypothetical protein
MGDKDAQMNILLELKKMEGDLDSIIGDYVPKHEIPDDPEARRRMGFPERYWRRKFVIPRSFDRRLNRTLKDENKQTSFEHDQAPNFDSLKKELEEFEEESRKRKAEKETEKKNLVGEERERETPAEGESEEQKGPIENTGKTSLREFYELREKAMRDSSKKGESKGKEAKEIKTTVFGRGFDGWDEEE